MFTKRIAFPLIFLLGARFLAFSQNAHQFTNPAAENRPSIFWVWQNDMITEKGITSDLQQFKKFGLDGVLIMLVGMEVNGRKIYTKTNMPNPVLSQTPEFFNMWRFAAEESARLGLTISSQLGTGWCHSGGPWVKPDQAVQHIAFTELQVKGNGKDRTFFVGDEVAGKAFAFHSDLSVSDESKWIEISLDRPGEIDEIRLHPFDNKGIKAFGFPVSFIIETALKPDFSEKQTFFSQTANLINPDRDAIVLKGKKVKAKYIRITANKNYSVLRSNIKQYLLSLSEVEIISKGKNVARNARIKTSGSIENVNYSAAAITDGFSMSTSFPGASANQLFLQRPGLNNYTSEIAIVAFPDKKVIQPEDIIELSKLKKVGKIQWKVPDGNWIIRRYAMRNALAYTRMAPEGGKGLESDKLSKGAVDAMFNGMVGKFIENSPQLRGKTIKAFEADSWEVGNPEWSEKFRDEFKTRRGYDPTPWLITYKSKEIIGSNDLTSRFFNDMYLTQTDLFADNFFSHLASKADSLGMDFMTEPYIAPFDPVRMGGRVQIPMAEFWASTEMMHTTRWASSSANTYGRKIVAAEAFTGRWNDGNWKMDPYAIKRAGDLAFANGINKMILHSAALQPWGMDHKPGTPMFHWGTIFIPGQTWWEPGKVWVNYLSRCQYMLTQGKNVADVVGLMPTLNWRGSMPEGLHKKYNYDLLSEEILLKDMDYKDGFFTLSSGARYRVLILPETKGMMSPKIIAKLLQLVKKGGTIVCEDKPSSSPGLTGYPEADNEVKKLVNELWGNADGKTIFENKAGAGKLIWMNEIWKDSFDPERKYFLETRAKGHEFWDNTAVTTRWSPGFMKLLNSITQPDVEVVKASGKAMAWGGRPETSTGVRDGEDAIAWTHRHSGDTDIYFVSSQVATENNAEILFRVKDKIPEIWDPETGKYYKPYKWSADGNRTRVFIPFSSFGSVFVVFKSKSAASPGLKFYRMGKFTDSISVDKKWDVSFQKGFGAPEKAQLNTGSWIENDVFGIKYFSGTATYETNINISKKQLKSEITIDLGNVKNLAEVIINGISADTLWKPPFRSEITSLLKIGENKITLKITNTWWNRRVGDQQLPEDLVWHENLLFAGNDYRGYQLKEFPEWVWTGQQRPSKERVTFSPWRFVEKDSPLEPSGLIGPVKLLLSDSD